jgi:predicted DNA-binding transcriptional regulator AlpA
MEIDKKINSKVVKEMLGGISEMTLSRFIGDENYAYMKFPKPIYINRRRFWSHDELQQWLENRPSKKPQQRRVNGRFVQKSDGRTS